MSEPAALLAPRRWAARDRHHAWWFAVPAALYLLIVAIMSRHGLDTAEVLLFAWMLPVVTLAYPLREWLAVSRREVVVDGDRVTLRQGDRVLTRADLAQYERVELGASTQRAERFRSKPVFYLAILVPWAPWVRPIELKVFAFSGRDFDALGDFVDSVIQPRVMAADRPELLAQPWESADLLASTSSEGPEEIRSAYLSRWWWPTWIWAAAVTAFFALVGAALAMVDPPDRPSARLSLVVGAALVLLCAVLAYGGCLKLRRGTYRVHLEADDEQLRGFRDGALEWALPWSDVAYLYVDGRYRWHGGLSQDADERMPSLHLVMLDPEAEPYRVQVYAIGDEAQALEHRLNTRLNAWRRRAFAHELTTTGGSEAANETDHHE